jgi:RimJ/RimL family protein N-acetyltransferase
MKVFPVIETDRLKLRPFRLDDSERVQSLAGSDDVAKTTLNMPHPYEDGMAEQWISRHLKEFVHDEGVTFAIERKEDGLLIGAIGLTGIRKHNRAVLGYWIGSEYWGNGYCTEAAHATINYGLREEGYHKILASHMKCNPASGRVMEKCGMKHEGTFVDHVLKNGQYFTIEYYAITRANNAV